MRTGQTGPRSPTLTFAKSSFIFVFRLFSKFPSSEVSEKSLRFYAENLGMKRRFDFRPIKNGAWDMRDAPPNPSSRILRTLLTSPLFISLMNRALRVHSNQIYSYEKRRGSNRIYYFNSENTKYNILL